MTSDESQDSATTIDDQEVDGDVDADHGDDRKAEGAPSSTGDASGAPAKSGKGGKRDKVARRDTVAVQIEPVDVAEPVEVVCGDVPLPMRVEAILISTDKPLSDGKLIELLGMEAKGAKGLLRETIEGLNAAYAETGRSFRIEPLAGGWQVLTQPEVGTLLARLHQVRQSSKLSQAALETLSIVAYRQPIMRAEIEAIRGVASGEVLRGLMERRLVKIVGRAEELGRPMLYGTTKEFLEVFGIANLDDLPAVEGLDRRPSSSEPA
jgi:segregation and condensation protein B